MSAAGQFLLDKTNSDPNAIGVNPDFLDVQGIEDPNFNIYSILVHTPLTEAVQQHISMVFNWLEDVLL